MSTYEERLEEAREEYAMGRHRFRHRSRCGGYASDTGHCGATDCATCYPGSYDDPNDFESSNRPWLADSDFEYDADDGEWSKVVSVKRHTCRRDHQDGTVTVGDVYLVTKTRYISDEDGSSCLIHRKWVVGGHRNRKA